MPTYPFMQVDAFTTRPLAGNPCAIIFEADDLTDSQMLAIAREMNLSETAFVLQSDKADVRARYFTPAEEIPLAGHPTIATIHALVETGRLAVAEGTAVISMELAVGLIAVEVVVRDGRAQQITMSQMKPRFLSIHDPQIMMPVFGLTSHDLLPGAVIQTVSTGTPQLMVPIRSLDALHRCRLDAAAYEALRAQADFFSPHFFCLSGITETGRTFARHFGVPPDTLEDPFTGSATGGMAAYLWHYGLIEQPKFVAEQGHWMGRPGQAMVEIIGPPEDIETVKVGGTAVTILRGECTI